MIRHLIIFAMVLLGTMLIDNDTWATAIGGCLLFVAGGMFGENEAKRKINFPITYVGRQNDEP